MKPQDDTPPHDDDPSALRLRLHALEAHLREVEERYDRVMGAMNESVYDWDVVGDQIAYSRGMHRVLGVPAEALLTPRDWLKRIHPADLPRYQAAIVACFKGIVPRFECDYRYHAEDDTWRWARQHGVAVFDEHGRAVRLTGSTGDITNLKRQEQQLAEKSAILETTLEHMDQGITMVDQDLTIIAHNRKFLDVLDFPAEQFGGRFHLEDALRFNAARGEYGPGDADEQVRVRLEMARRFEPHAFERTRPDGTVLAIRGLPLPGGAGFVTTYTDVTEWRRAEEALRASQQELAQQAAKLEQQNEALKEHVKLREEVDRIGRHDLKTPIASIIAVPRLLREGRALSRDEEELLNIVERAGYRLLHMVNLSLDLFKMEQGTYRFQPQVVDLRGLLDKLVLDVASHAHSKGVVVRPSAGAHSYAWGEELLCYSMLGNLVKNAIEASPEDREITLTIDTVDDDVQLVIHNAGAVPLAVRDAFFDKYVSAGKGEGTGLGTYSARLMARTQGGDIEMATSETEGTTITVHLRKAPAGAAPAPGPAAAEQAGNQAKTDALPALRVLIVDDDEYNRLIVRRYLPSPPMTVATSVNGRDAVDSVHTCPVDVILMDLDMPIMGGFEATNLIRNLERTEGRLPCTILALSSHDDEATYRRCLASGFDHYFTKPVTRELLHRVLRAIAEARQTSRTVETPNASPRSAAISADDTIVIDADLQKDLPGFLDSRRQVLDDFDEALLANDTERLRGLAHKLAGSFGMYGFRWAADTCREMERQARTGETQSLRTPAAALRRHLQQATIRFEAVQ